MSKHVTRYYTDNPFFYGEFKYQVTCVEGGVSNKQAWYHAILDIQNYFGWTHWCDLLDLGSHRYTIGIHYDQIRIVKIGLAPYEKQTRPFRSKEEAKQFREKIIGICQAMKYNPDNVNDDILKTLGIEI